MTRSTKSSTEAMSEYLPRHGRLRYLREPSRHKPPRRDGAHRSSRRRRLGEVSTSDYVFDEAVTAALRRTRRPDAALRVGRLILGTGPLGRLTGLVYSSPEVFLRSWQRFFRLINRGLSFTNCTFLELMRSLRVDEIASFDADFDAFVVRRSNRPA